MANDAKFTHISVTIDDDDDFVIEVGAPAEEVAEPQAAEPAPQAVEPEPDAPVVEPEPIAVAAPAASAPAPAKAAAKGYRETTLEDLEVEKMSGMQKGVIAAAFVAIIVFIVYLVL